MSLYNFIRSADRIRATWSICLGLLFLGGPVLGRQVDDLEKQATWTSPSSEEVENQIRAWMDAADLDDATRTRIEDAWDASSDGSQLSTNSGTTSPVVVTSVILLQHCQLVFMSCVSIRVAPSRESDVAPPATD